MTQVSKQPTNQANMQEDRFHCQSPMVGLTKAHPKYSSFIEITCIIDYKNLIWLYRQ